MVYDVMDIKCPHCNSLLIADEYLNTWKTEILVECGDCSKKYRLIIDITEIIKYDK